MFEIIAKNRGFDKKASEEASSLFSTAVNYLRKSEFAQFIIDQLNDSKSLIKIEAGPNLASEWNPSAFTMGNHAGSVDWCTQRKTIEEYQQYGSAALALMHELGHAYQYLSEKKRSKLIILSKKIFRIERWVLRKLEITNTQAVELTVAHEINKELIFMRGPNYKWLEPIRHKYLTDTGAPQAKSAITDGERKKYVAELRKEGRSPTPVFYKKGFHPKDVNFLTLV